MQTILTAEFCADERQIKSQEMNELLGIFLIDGFLPSGAS
jgi:hypothetical protein